MNMNKKENIMTLPCKLGDEFFGMKATEIKITEEGIIVTLSSRLPRMLYEQKVEVNFTNTHLCRSCVFDYPTCPSFEMIFGSGLGGDNVVLCDSYELQMRYKNKT